MARKGTRNARPQNKSAKASRNRALNAFDTAVDDQYYMKGLRQQQDIDLEHIADDRIRELLSNQVNSEDDEEIDSDEAIGSGSDISLSEPESENEDEWGDSLDEAELLPLSEVWDLDDAENGVDTKKSSAAVATTEISGLSESASEVEAESGSGSESESESESEPEGNSESESLGLSDSNVSDDEEDDDDNTDALRRAIQQVSGAGNLSLAGQKLVEAGEENPFALPLSAEGEDLSISDLAPGVSVGKTVAMPAPKRIQERADRSAAYKIAKEEVNKWADTVQANRQAEHLQFPINAPQEMEIASPFAPFKADARSELEKKVAAILETSALADENAISTFEEQAPSTLSVEEVRKRRDQLRFMRELMFREEQRAKRIKKIKSKKYRKIHKKERERMADLEREGESGEDAEEAELDRAERDRVLERATLRHKTNSKWAKRMLSQGLTRDAGTRAEIEEMLRQGDALRQKIRGNEEDSDSVGNSDADLDLEVEAQRIEDSASATPQKGVLGMKFMRDAEEKQREANKRSLRDDYDSDSESEQNAGRKSFTPAGQQLKRDMKALEEEGVLDEDDDEPSNGLAAKSVKNTKKRSRSASSGKLERGDEAIEFQRVDEPVSEYAPRQSRSSASRGAPSRHATDEDAVVEENPWLKAAAASSGPTGSGKGTAAAVKLASRSHNPVGSKTRSAKNTIVVENTLGDSLVREKDLTLQQQDLVRQAFAGDDVAAEFAAEKQAEIDEDGDQEIDETLPGWGSWSNEQPRVRKIRKIAGINEKQRKDYKRQGVILNEKANKKSAKYAASAVPFPFENRQQYERSLRMPIGQEWVTKDTFQRQTKPRVLVKRGTVIDPLEKPQTN